VALRHDEPTVEKVSLALFPNPARDLATICGLQSLGNYLVTVTDVFGNVVMSAEIKANLLGEGQMELGDLACGVYFMTFTSNEGSWMLKFVKN
jgi:hypothetical protein